MKRLLILLTLLASVAGAQIVPAGSGNTAIGSGSPVSGCTSSILYTDAASLLKCDPSAVVNGSSTAASRSILTIKDSMSVGDGTENFLKVVGTMPTIISGHSQGVLFDITGAGSSAMNTTSAVKIFYRAGFTGVNETKGLDVQNQTTATGNTFYAANKGGVFSTFGTTTGNNMGSQSAAYASSAMNVGAAAIAPFATNSPALNIGLWGKALGATVNVAGYFTLADLNGIPTLTSSALTADNGSQTANITEMRDNGTVVQAVQDGGSLYSKMGTKALTLGGGAVTFVRVGVASNTFQGGFIDWCADANDATDYQTRCGILPFSIVNKGGTETCTVGTPGAATESVAASAGTFTVAFTTDTATPTNGCDFQANGTSSLTETVMRINYTVRLVGNAATAVTPQ